MAPWALDKCTVKLLCRIEASLAEYLQSRRATRDDVYFEPPVADQAADEFAHERTVVDEQYLPGRRHTVAAPERRRELMCLRHVLPTTSGPRPCLKSG